jgi:hypothetical protein
MMTKTLLARTMMLTAMLSLSGLPAVGIVQQPSAALKEALAKLRPEDRQTGQAFLSETDVRTRIELAAEFAEAEDAASLEFLIAALDAERSVPVRRALVGFIGGRRDERGVKVLEAVAATDSDAQVTALAKDHVSLYRARQARAAAVRSGRGGPPPADPTPEPVTLPGASVRFLVIGDFGTCERMNSSSQCIEGSSDPQQTVAKAIAALHGSGGTNRFDFGITVGDNFYDSGVAGAGDPRWKHDWEDRYSGLGIRFHASVGNHDHDGGSQSINGQIGYSQKSKSWLMSAAYRPLLVGDGRLLQMFAIDTDVLLDDEDQLPWLARALADSRQREPNAWRIVFGHHPVVSGGSHGVNGELADYREKLLPILKAGGVHMYIAGHDHDLQLLKVEGVYQMISGAAGKKRGVKKIPESVFCREGFGFAVVDASAASLRLDYRSDSLPPASVYSCTISKDPATGALTDTCKQACK